MKSINCEKSSIFYIFTPSGSQVNTNAENFVKIFGHETSRNVHKNLYGDNYQKSVESTYNKSSMENEALLDDSSGWLCKPLHNVLSYKFWDNYTECAQNGSND